MDRLGIECPRGRRHGPLGGHGSCDIEFLERMHEAPDEGRVLTVQRESSLLGLLRGTAVVEFEKQSA